MDRRRAGGVPTVRIGERWFFGPRVLRWREVPSERQGDPAVLRPDDGAVGRGDHQPALDGTGATRRPLGPRLGAATRESIARWALSDPVGECAETKEAT